MQSPEERFVTGTLTAHLPPQYNQLMPDTAFSASSRLFDLNGEANRIRKDESSAIIADGVLGYSVTQSIRMRFSIHT